MTLLGKNNFPTKIEGEKIPRKNQDNFPVEIEEDLIFEKIDYKKLTRLRRVRQNVIIIDEDVKWEAMT